MIFIVMHKTCMTSSLTSSLESTSTNGLDLLALSFELVASSLKSTSTNGIDVLALSPEPVA